MFFLNGSEKMWPRQGSISGCGTRGLSHCVEQPEALDNMAHEKLKRHYWGRFLDGNFVARLTFDPQRKRTLGD